MWRYRYRCSLSMLALVLRQCSTANQASLLRVALLLSGDPHRAEEAVAEAFARVWPLWGRGRVKDDAAYLRRAVVNEVHSSGRRLGRQDRAARRHTSSAAPDVPFDEDSVQRDVLLAALATLPKGQRAVIVLRFYDDLSEAATAAKLGMRIRTVKPQRPGGCPASGSCSPRRNDD